MSDTQVDLPPSRDDPDATVAPGLHQPARPRPALYPFLAPPREADELGRLGPFRVLRLLGQGRMGLVFQGQDVKLGRAVALKVMLPEWSHVPAARERFLREARSAAALEHDNVVPIYHVGEDEGIPYLVMPLLKGQTLDAYLRRGRPLSIGQVLRIARHVARGLQAAHERGLIHRDIKPANLWLDSTAGGRVKILDFGLARPQEDTGRLTSAGMVIGSPAYMAPEQIDGKPEARSDLYSLGVVLYRLLAGRLPFDHDDPAKMLSAVCFETPAPLARLAPAVPPALAALVMRLMARRPDDRPGSARAFLEELKTVERELAQGEDVEASLEVPATSDDEAPTENLRAPRPVHPSGSLAAARTMRWALLLGGVGLLLLCVGLGLLWAARRRPAGPPSPGNDGASRPPAPGFVAPFEGLTAPGWELDDGVLRCKGPGHPDLRTRRTYGDFELELECRFARGSDGGVLLRLAEGEFPRPVPVDRGVEVHLCDQPRPGPFSPRPRCGGLIEVMPPSTPHQYSGPGTWNRFRIVCQAGRVTVEHNGGRVVDVTVEHPRLAGMPKRGAIGLRNLGPVIEFRNIRLRELP